MILVITSNKIIHSYSTTIPLYIFTHLRAILIDTRDVTGKKLLQAILIDQEAEDSIGILNYIPKIRVNFYHKPV